MMAEDRDGLLQHYRDTRAELLALIEGVSDEALSQRTLDGWSVKDHLAHLATWDDVRASEVERISAGHASAWRMSDEQDDAYNALTYALREGMSIEQAKWELAASRRRLLDAITTASDRGLDSSLYGDAALRSDHEAEHIGWIKRWRREQGI
jgi:uncharacterized damage-inducible protein DinB